MATSLLISKTIRSLADLETRFGLRVTPDTQFFTKWRTAETTSNAEISEMEQRTLVRLRDRFAAHRHRGTVDEGSVDKLLLSPLLDLAGFYEPGYSIRTEASVEFAYPETDELLKGRIDTLVMRDNLWVLVVEAKRIIMASLAIPQALTYMMAAPQPETPVFGLVSNGDEFIFLKLQASPEPQYSTSRQYSMFLPPDSQDILSVYQVLKQIQASV